MNKKGFTLIEVIAVIIIIGVMLLIAVPNVTGYIFTSRKSSFATDIHAYLETVRAEYLGREYGPLVEDEELLIVPIKNIILEKGDAGQSPFGNYVYDKSYIVVAPEKSGYEYYANVLDESKHGVIMTPYSVLDKDEILEDASAINAWPQYNGTEAIFTFKEQAYKWCETRSPKGKTSEESPILLLCKEG